MDLRIASKYSGTALVARLLGVSLEAAEPNSQRGNPS
jgi:hypothetical protein